MKWTNPGHQMDYLGAKYLEVTNLYIYGVDEKAKKTYEFLCWLGVADEFDISFVLDVTVLNQRERREFCGKRIIAFQTDLCEEMQAAPEFAVIALPWIAQTTERKILEQKGVKNIFYLLHSHNRSDNFIQNFLCVWMMYKHNKLISHWTSYLVTSRCNLNCKYCLNFTEYISSPTDITFEMFKENIDAIFSKFDYLYSLHLCGGEPLMAKELPQMISYIEENYKDRIFDFFLITNGTLMPNSKVISAIKSLDGHFLIDDYSATVQNTKLENIKEILENNQIEYAINKVDFWFDLDIEHTDYSTLSEVDLECHKDSCQRFLHDIGEKRIYGCCYQQYAHRAGKAVLEEGDYIEIDSASKMEILEFRQGYTKKGYVSFCKNCRGIGDSAKLTPAAVQIPRRNIVGKTAALSPIVSKKEDILISICVPIYNTGKYLMRCIDSLLNQSYKNLEIILVDDGSMDGSELICDEYAAMDKRVTIIHKSNGGEASARNAGLQSAKGEFLMFIDSDDEYFPNAVQLMLDAIREKDVDLVIGGYLEKRGEQEYFATGHQRICTSSETALSYLDMTCPYSMPYLATTVNAKLFRRGIIQEQRLSFDERFVIGNDSVFMCNYLKHTRNVYNIFSPLYIYYKFQPAERIQGMSWYYPDAFFLFAYVADRMIKIANPDEGEMKRLVTKQYKDLLYSLVNATANVEHFENGLLPYLTSFCDEIDFLQTAAQLDLFEGYIQKENGALPIRLISYFIVNKRYKDLYQLLQALGKMREVVPYKGEYVRQMIRMVPNGELTQKLSGLVDDPLLMEQVDELASAVAIKQQKIEEATSKNVILEAQVKHVESRNMILEAQVKNADAKNVVLELQAKDVEARNATLEIQLGEAKSKANAFEEQLRNAEAKIQALETLIQQAEARFDQITNSRSWRITKPLRISMDIFRRLKK